MRILKTAPFTLILVAILAVVAPLHGAKKPATEEPALEPVPDNMVPRYLTTPQILEWEKAIDAKELAESQLSTSKWLLNRPPSTLRSAEEDAKSKAEGQRLKTEGEAGLKAAEAKLDSFRKLAAEIKASRTVKVEPVLYPMELEPARLKNALFPATEELLLAIWNLGYTRIYFGGAYVTDTGVPLPEYVKDESLGSTLSKYISRLDGNRFTYVKDSSIPFSLTRQGNRTVIDFPDRSAILRNFKSAYVVAELAYDSLTDSAILSLRGLDMANGSIVASEVIIISVDDSVREFAVEFTEEVEGEEPAETLEATETEETPVATTKDPVPGKESSPDAIPEGTTEEPEVIIAKRMAVQLRDDNNFLGRVTTSGTPYIFTVELVGDTRGFNSRAATMLTKVILLEKKLNVSDNDFLFMVMDKPEGIDSPREEANAVLKLTPLGSTGQGRTAYDVEAISLIGSNASSVPVGLMQTALIIQEPQANLGGS